MSVTLLTGASRGIGRHLALGLAGAGHDLGLVATDEGRLRAVREEILAARPEARVLCLAADVTDASRVESVVRRVETELGGIDLLVNNAGRIDAEVPLWEADPDEWWNVMAVNVKAPFLFARAVVPGMIARGGGRIVNINSGSGTRDAEDATAYAASKTALFRVGGSVHLAAPGVHTFEMAPGVVRTDMTNGMRHHEGRTEWTEPGDVVALLLALARGDADHLSGSYLRVGLDRPEDLPSRTFVRRLGLVEETLGPKVDPSSSTCEKMES